MLVTQKRIGSVVAQKKHQRFLRHSELIEMIQHVAQRLVHPLDQGGEGLGPLRFSRVRIVSGETGIRIERRVDGIVREVEKEWLLRTGAFGDLLLCFQRQCLCQESRGAVIGFEVGHGMRFATGSLPVVFSP